MKKLCILFFAVLFGASFVNAIPWENIHPSYDYLYKDFSKPQNQSVQRVMVTCKKVPSSDLSRCYNIATYVNRNKPVLTNQICNKLTQLKPGSSKKECLKGLGRFTY